MSHDTSKKPKTAIHFSVESILARKDDEKQQQEPSPKRRKLEPGDELECAAERRSSSDGDDDDDADDDGVSSTCEIPRPEPKSAAAAACSPGYICKDGITVELVGQELWKKFHKLGTEMIITKAGRRMFPTLKIRVSGLDPNRTYAIFLEIVPFDDKRYRYVYQSSQWMTAGAGDPQPSPNTFVHSDSPSTGLAWTSHGVVAFDKLKLTNNRSSGAAGQICLHSMHKYIPRVHVQQVQLGSSPEQQKATLQRGLDRLLDSSSSSTFVFPETVFTTVTAYQNQQITKLKIASNPFAKGFREATRTRDTPGDFSSGFLNLSRAMDLYLASASVAAASRPQPFYLPSLPAAMAEASYSPPLLPPSPILGLASLYGPQSVHMPIALPFVHFAASKVGSNLEERDHSSAK